MGERIERLRQAFAALDDGDAGGFRELFTENARWLGLPGATVDGETPT